MFVKMQNIFSLILLVHLESILTSNVINFALFWPEGSQEIEDTNNFTHIIQYGVDYVNDNRNNILTNYTLNWKFFNSGCSSKTGIRAYIDMLEDETPYMFIIGPSCTTAAEAVAQDITSENILMISYQVTSPTFSDVRVYPNLFRVFPSDSGIANAMSNFIIQQGWKRIALITQTEDLFTGSTQIISSTLNKKNIKSRNFLFYDNNTIPGIVEEVIRQKYRIIVGSFYRQEGLNVLCEFYKNRERTGKIIWILYGWLPRGFWNITEFPPCTSESFLDQLEFSIGFESFPRSDFPDKETFLKITTDEFENMFQNQSNIEEYLFDAFQAMVNALNIYQNEFSLLCENDSKYCLNSYIHSHNSSNDYLIKPLRNILYQNGFLGVSGLINFTTNGDRIENVSIIQWKSNGERMYIGSSSSQSEYIKLNPINWPGGQDVVPSDGTEVEDNFVSYPQFAIFAFFAVIGIIICVSYIIIIIIYRNHAVIKAYNPILTATFLTGTIVLLVWVILFQVPGLNISSAVAFDVTCNISNWVGTIGFTLMFIPTFLKTIKAFYLKEYHLKNPTKRNKFRLEESHLLMGLLVFLIIDVIYLIIWTAVPMLRYQQQIRTSEYVENNIEIVSTEYYCGTNPPINRQIMLSIVIGYNALFVVAAMLIVIDTRTMKYVGLKESTWIGIGVYALAVLGSIAIVCHEIIQGKVEIRYGIVSSMVIIALMVIVNLQFVPLLVLVIKDPSGKKRYGVEVKDTMTETDAGRQLNAKITVLMDENVQLKNELKDIKEHVERQSMVTSFDNLTKSSMESVEKVLNY